MSQGARPRTSTPRTPPTTRFSLRAVVHTGPEQHARFSRAEEKQIQEVEKSSPSNRRNFYNIRIRREDAHLEKINKGKGEFKNKSFQDLSRQEHQLRRDFYNDRLIAAERPLHLTPQQPENKILNTVRPERNIHPRTPSPEPRGAQAQPQHPVNQEEDLDFTGFASNESDDEHWLQNLDLTHLLVDNDTTGNSSSSEEEIVQPIVLPSFKTWLPTNSKLQTR